MAEIPAKCPRSTPQGINGWVETHPYQPTLIYASSIPGRNPRPTEHVFPPPATSNSNPLQLLPQKADHVIRLHHAYQPVGAIHHRQRVQVVFVEKFCNFILVGFGRTGNDARLG